MVEMWSVAKTFAQTRWRNRMSRPAFERWQGKALERWLQRDVPQVPFYNGARRLEDLPVVDKATVMDQFEAFNKGGITAAEGWAHFDAGSIGDISVGASTGTSGNRALYVITPQERARWLGVMLAKALPQFPWRAERVAVILPQSSELYDTAARARRLELAFFDLREGVEAWADELCRYDPTCIVGPPRVLRLLAEQGQVAPRMVYSSAETLDPVDRAVIETEFNLKLGQIYMATEGLFAVTCPHGRLHLAEDTVFFEFEPAGDGLVNPVVSCFQRQFQIMARYRMNDLLRLSDTPCTCGSPLRVVDEVVGRMDDVFTFGDVFVTPDVLRNAVLNADRDITDFRVWRTGERCVEVLLPEGSTEEQLAAARRAVETALANRVTVDVLARTAPLGFDKSRKLRRVENRWTS